MSFHIQTKTNVTLIQEYNLKMFVRYKHFTIKAVVKCCQT